jgi:hypothetical protein
MDAAFNLLFFALERVRTVLMALALIMLLKAAWIMIAPALGVS